MARIAGIYEFGPFRLDPSEHCLSRNGVEVPLQLKAFETLCILVRHAGRLLAKEEILRQVWPDAMVEENNLNKNVSLLRKALGQPGDSRSYIETVPRVGYRFVGPVSHVEPQISLATPDQRAEADAQGKKSVAVLYFENLSGAREDEYFRDGITEDVITELAKIKELRLFPRSSVLAYRDTPLAITQVGQQLQA